MKPLHLAGILLSAMVLGVLVIHKSQTQEPSYQGRTVRQWLYEDLGTGKETFAIQHLGTNAISSLLAMVGYRDSFHVVKLNELLRKQSLISFRFQTSSAENYLGKRGFDFLGTNAISAGPQLTILAQDKSFVVRVCALSALISIDPSKETLRKSVSQILRDSKDPDVRKTASHSLES